MLKKHQRAAGEHFLRGKVGPTVGRRQLMLVLQMNEYVRRALPPIRLHRSLGGNAG